MLAAARPAAARPRNAGKHRKTDRRRSIAALTRPSVLVGTGVVAVVAAAWLPPAGSARGETRVASRTPVGVAAPAPAAAGFHTTGTTAYAALVRLPGAAKTSGPARTLFERELTQRRHFTAADYWVKPVAHYELTAHFGESSHLWAHRHTGQDFAAPTGTPVLAANEGVVMSAEPAGAYGNRLVIRHAGGLETWYCHLSAFLVHPGDRVHAGQVVAKVGATGNTTGPHLHFEVRPRENDPINPVPWLRSHGVLV